MSDRWPFLLWCLLGLVGMAAFWNGGSFSERGFGMLDESPKGKIAIADYDVYGMIVTRVCAGENYYAAARRVLPNYYPRYHSTFNWRLPTYAYLFAGLQNDGLIRAVLLLLVGGGMIGTYWAERRERGFLAAAGAAFLLFLTLAWCFTPAMITQELWAAVFIALGLVAYSFERRFLSVVFFTLALSLRELVLPYLVVAGAIALGRRRWLEALAWAAGCALFFAYLYWHHLQVQTQLAQMAAAPDAGVSQWLQFGGVNFVLLTGRMINIFLQLVPGGVVFLVMWIALRGLWLMPGDRGWFYLLTTLAFWLAFTIVGEPQNLYWGLLYAPMIVVGFGCGFTPPSYVRS